MGQSVTESIGRAAGLAVGGVGGASIAHAGSGEEPFFIHYFPLDVTLDIEFFRIPLILLTIIIFKFANGTPVVLW